MSTLERICCCKQPAKPLFWHCGDCGEVVATPAGYFQPPDGGVEPTEEMVEAFSTAHYRAEWEYQRKVDGRRGKPYRSAADRAGVIAGLRAALAVQQKEG